MLLLIVCTLPGGVSASQESDNASRAAAVAAAAAAGGYKGRSTGRCERITIPLCLDMKYNMTRMPNLVGHSTQAEAAMQVRSMLLRFSFRMDQSPVFHYCRNQGSRPRLCKASVTTTIKVKS